jgi:predicted homoserine dehydrogenase-like protein
MVNVEADVLVGPLLAQRARSAGVTYSLAYGDQPALICELVDWARLCGFEVVCAGKGTKYLPAFRTSTPDTVWDHYGFSQEQIRKGGFNPRMFNSFLDGTKSAIEMAAVSNATGLMPAPGGLDFPPCGIKDLPNVCKPHLDGGTLSHKGTVEVVSSLNRDGSPVPDDLRWGVFVTFEAPGDYVAQCFSEYGLVTDSSGNYTAMYRPYHLVGLELAISVISAGLNAGPTGSPVGFHADVVATAKRDLAEGEELDGEGGNCVYGSLKRVETGPGIEGFPIGLAHKVRLKNRVSAGSQLLWSDVTYNPNNPIVEMRLEMQDKFGNA